MLGKLYFICFYLFLRFKYYLGGEGLDVGFIPLVQGEAGDKQEKMVR